MIKPICYKCKREIKEFGALLFSPPMLNDTVHKMHLCLECYKKVLHIIEISE